MEYRTWLLWCLVIIELALTGYSIFWILLVSKPIFLAACGSAQMAIGILIALFSLSSVVLKGLGHSRLGTTASTNSFFDVWFLVMTFGLSFCAVGLVATCPESQAMYQRQIDAYVSSFDDNAAGGYLLQSDSDYKRLVFQFAFGQNSYEAFSILGLAWLSFHVAFCAVRELYSEDALPNAQWASGE
jgi:hypothetical protein